MHFNSAAVSSSLIQGGVIISTQVGGKKGDTTHISVGSSELPRSSSRAQERAITVKWENVTITVSLQIKRVQKQQAASAYLGIGSDDSKVGSVESRFDILQCVLKKRRENL